MKFLKSKLQLIVYVLFSLCITFGFWQQSNTTTEAKHNTYVQNIEDCKQSNATHTIIIKIVDKATQHYEAPAGSDAKTIKMYEDYSKRALDFQTYVHKTATLRDCSLIKP